MTLCSIKWDGKSCSEEASGFIRCECELVHKRRPMEWLHACQAHIDRVRAGNAFLEDWVVKSDCPRPLAYFTDKGGIITDFKITTTQPMDSCLTVDGYTERKRTPYYDRGKQMPNYKDEGEALRDKVCEFMGLPKEDHGKISSALFTGTSCGAWIQFTEFGLAMGSIVEGSDQDCETHELVWTGEEDISDWMSKSLNKIEAEAILIWKEWNTPEETG